MREEILWIVVALSLASGLIGAYGRERHEGRRPDGSWWITRVCIMPFLAIVVAFCIDQFHLTRQQSALLASLLALMGYEAVRVILERAQKRGAALVDAALPQPKPYVSIVDTDAEGRPTAHVVITPGEHTIPGPHGDEAAALGQALQSSFRGPTTEPLPDDMRRLLGDDDLGI